MKTVGEVMTSAPRTIGSHVVLEEAKRIMSEHSVRHLPVLHGGRLVGIVSDRDIAMVEGLPGVDVAEVKVDEAMSPDVLSTTPDGSLRGVAQQMAERRIGTTIVVDPSDVSRVVGILTTTDLLRALAQLLPEG
jgi:acetoin utilization protein AcuB